jgi:hypothetical protein
MGITVHYPLHVRKHFHHADPWYRSHWQGTAIPSRYKVAGIKNRRPGSVGHYQKPQADGGADRFLLRPEPGYVTG